MADQSLSDQELVHKLLQTERDLVGARFKHSMNQLEDTASVGILRRNMARLRTLARERERSQGLPKNAILEAHSRSFSGKADDGAGEAVEKGGFLSGIVDKLAGND